MSTRISIIASTLVVTGGLAVGTIGTAAVANATREQDVTYVGLLADYGITVTDRAGAIENAYTMCAMFDEGYAVSEVMDELASGEGDFETMYLANYVATAVTVYCPEHL